MRHYLALLLLPILFASCTESTSSIGIFPETDGIANSYALHNVYTQSILLDSVLYKSSYNYLGSIKDPETNVEIKANFAAQFHTFENYRFPSRNLLFPDCQNTHSEDPVECDSIELRLFYNGYYGDPNNPMKLEIYPLSFNKIIEEDSVYYVNTNLEDYVDAGTEPIATKVFTAIDYSVSEDVREDDDYTNNIRIVLPKEYGNKMLNAYYEHPEYYKNSYTFIRNICPGFFFKIKSGTGTMVNVEVSTLNLYFTYYDANEPDSAYASICRFAATPEVIQSTQFTNGNLQQLVDDDNCTYLKSPAGIGTEMTLPINEIYAGHETDSISKAQLTLTRYNNSTNNDYTLGIPQNVVMIRKDDMISFFKDKKLPNSQTSYIATFNETYNTYSFDNLGRLITYCHYEKMAGTKKLEEEMEGETKKEIEEEIKNEIEKEIDKEIEKYGNELTQEELEKEWEEKWEEKWKKKMEELWEKANPNWNKMVIVPVSVLSTTDSYGYTTYASITHDMSMCSTKLVGGPNNPIKMQILYSRFK